MSRSRPIPWLILLLGVGFTAFTAWSFYRAVHGTSAVIDADYYSHGLRYNQTLLERQAAASLGWQAVPHLEGRLLSIQLRDHDQQLVTDAQGSLTLLGTGSPPMVRLACGKSSQASTGRNCPPGCAANKRPKSSSSVTGPG